jgi:hypothetical protein
MNLRWQPAHCNDLRRSIALLGPDLPRTTVGFPVCEQQGRTR